MSVPTHKIMIEVTTGCRERMRLGQALMQLYNPEIKNPTWSDVVEWLAFSVPIPALMAEACAEAEANGDKENKPNGTADTHHPSTGSRRTRVSG